MERNIKIFNERGGMLVELMMTLAITAILIPFLFRYQQNMVEHAQNIAIAKQMETVQDAFEKYIVKNRSTYIVSIPNGSSQTITLSQIANFLPFGFLDDNNNPTANYGEYSLRILKPNANVLQGIVFLSNDKASQTRQIANLGGGKIGYTDGNTTIRGGFNVFEKSKSDMGISQNQKGLVGTTATSSNDTEYLWRLGSDSGDGAINATMRASLDLGGHNIKGVDNVSVNQANFSLKLTANRIQIRNALRFFGTTPSLNGNNINFSADDAYATGMIKGNQLELNVHNNNNNATLFIHDTGVFTDLISKGPEYLGDYGYSDEGGLRIKTIDDLNNLIVGSDDVKINRLEISNKGIFAVRKVTAINDLHLSCDDGMYPGTTPQLSVGEYICPARANDCGVPGNENKYTGYIWDATTDGPKGRELRLKNIALTDVYAAIDIVFQQLHSNGQPSKPATDYRKTDCAYHLYSDYYLHENINSRTSIKEILKNLCKVKAIITFKANCLKGANWPEGCNSLMTTIPASKYQHCQ